MNALGILGTILGGALAVRPKRRMGAADFLFGGRGGFLNASTIATVAAGAWAVNEMVQRSRGPSSTTVAPQIPDAPPRSTTVVSQGPARAAPAPSSAATATLSPDMLRLVRLTVAATLCDGQLSAKESERLVADARAAGIQELVQAELQRPRPLHEIVAGVGDPAHKRDLYTLAFTVVRADEGVDERERAWLDELATRLALDPADVAGMEKDVAARIDRAA